MATPNGPYADTRDMAAVHTMFRREFALMPGLVRGVRAGDKERAHVVGDHIELVSSVLHQHHRGEDKHLWPKLLARASADVVPIVHTMEGQHQSLERIITEIASAIPLWRNSAAPESGKVLADALDRLNPQADEHMSVEEERILPTVEKYVTAAEWDQMVQDEAARGPQDQLPLLFGMFMYETDPDVVVKVLLRMPAEVRPAIKEVASQAFGVHSMRIHGTATPPRSR